MTKLKKKLPAAIPGTTDPLDTEAKLLLEEQRRIASRLHELGCERPPVKLSKLAHGAGGIVDRVFASFVSMWMDRNMRGFDVTDLTDVDGNHDIGDWEFEPEGRFEVREFLRPDPSMEGATDEVLYYLVDTENWRYEKEGNEMVFPPVNDGDRRNYDSDAADEIIRIGDDDACAWLDEDDAQAAARCMELAANAESRCGFPWAWNWSYRPEDWISTANLIAAGFVVATYKGDTRMCGIDGGGYNFDGAHYAKLVALECIESDTLVETESGPRRIVIE